MHLIVVLLRGTTTELERIGTLSVSLSVNRKKYVYVWTERTLFILNWLNAESIATLTHYTEHGLCRKNEMDRNDLFGALLTWIRLAFFAVCSCAISTAEISAFKLIRSFSSAHSASITITGNSRTNNMSEDKCIQLVGVTQNGCRWIYFFIYFVRSFFIILFS